MPNLLFTGERLGVTFHRGMGRTKYVERAKRFSEEFGYRVIPSKGAERWIEVGEEFAKRFPDLGPEDSPRVPIETELEPEQVGLDPATFHE